MINIAINGFGRIGRCLLRAILELKCDKIQVVAINTPGSTENCAHLLKYDSVHGTFGCDVGFDDTNLYVSSKKIAVTHERDIKNLNWSKKNIDCVAECSGIFNKREKLLHHISAGAKKVLVSAPLKDADCTIVHGVNNAMLKPDHKIISVGSCTTNCLAPVLYVLQQGLGVKNAFMTTVHSYTNDQNVVDNNHKKDMQRARACCLSMIPTTTGAAKTISNIIPELKGKIDGVAIRVPTPNVSLLDLTLNVMQKTTKEGVNKLFKHAEEGFLKGILATCKKPLVSIDFNHNTSSAVVDLNGTNVIDQNLVRVSAWYDNEWGFCARMVDMLCLYGSA